MEISRIDGHTFSLDRAPTPSEALWILETELERAGPAKSEKAKRARRHTRNIAFNVLRRTIKQCEERRNPKRRTKRNGCGCRKRGKRRYGKKVRR